MRDMRGDQIGRDQVGEIYTVPFSAVAFSVAMDMFEINVAAARTVRIREIVIGQYSDFGDAQSEILPLTFLQGHGTTGSGGSAPTPNNVDGNETRTLLSAVACNNTVLATAGTAVLKYADVWNVASKVWYYPPQAGRFWIPPSTRFVIRIGAPADGMTINGTLTLEETGLSP